MPFEECLDTAPGETVKEIAVLTRVGRPTCFVVQGTTQNESGEAVYLLSRAAAQRAYRRASAVSTALLVLALAVVIAAFVLGDFGAAFLTGWGNRYLLAGAVLAAMGLLVLGGLFAGKYRAIFLATVLQAREESETDN